MPAGTLPEQFGRYRILKQLGKGGMGAVYLAEDTQLGRRVALKVPHIEADAGSSVLERFYREARAAATLNHPNICPVHDVGTHDGIPYLTMAYIEGQTLADAIKSGKLFPQTAAARIVHTLALALADAHRRGVVHRDLKPANVMMNERGEPVVMDFGLARLAGANAARLTGSGTLLGTPAYMSPEQVNGDVQAIGPPCDIYSLGVILYELLTGHIPFEGSVGAVLGQILTQAPKPPSASRPDLDPRLEAICLKAMQKEIVARYASMTEFAWALGETLQPASPPIAAAARAQTQRRRVPADTRHETAPILATQPAAKPVPDSRTHPVAARLATLDATETARIGRRSAVAGFGAGCGIATVLGIIGLLGVAVVVAIVLWVGKAPDPGPQDMGKNGNDKDKLPLLAVEDALIREMNFRPVPKGTFWMGGGSVEAPRASQVTIANDFELAAYTVTQRQWEAVMGDASNLSWFSRKGKGSNSVANVADADLKRFPVEMVSWFDIQTFLEKLNERQQGKKWKYRLPKEAEWEYACRGAATTKEGCSFDFYFANGTYDLSWDQANFNCAFPVGNGKKGTILTRTAKVGQYPPNKLGLYDMHGNVWQWCEDLYDNSGSERVIRGGSWFSVGQNCRAAYRYRYVPAERFYDLGFRVARVKG